LGSPDLKFGRHQIKFRFHVFALHLHEERGQAALRDKIIRPGRILKINRLEAA
jgi:hypothetical protein